MLKNPSFVFSHPLVVSFAPHTVQHLLAMPPMLPVGPKAHNIEESTQGPSMEDTPTWGKDTHPVPEGTSKDPKKKYLPADSLSFLT